MLLKQNKVQQKFIALLISHLIIFHVFAGNGIIDGLARIVWSMSNRLLCT